MTTRPTALRGEAGFTIIEVMVAAMLLVVGLLGVVTLVNAAAAVTGSNKAREGATNLSRQLLEFAKTLPYDQLSTASGNDTMDPLLQSQFPDVDGAAAGWQIRRRNITFTVTTSACQLDDAKDGARASGTTFCPGSTPAGGSPVDPNPDDFRRVEVAVSWTLNGNAPSCKNRLDPATLTVQSGTGQNCVVTSELIANPSGGLGPQIVSITYTPNQDPLETGASATFRATTSGPADQLDWAADDGISSGTATAVNGSLNKQWDFTWNFPGSGGSQVLDGPHTVTAQAFLLSAAGIARPRTINLNRFIPTAPTVNTTPNSDGVNSPAGGVDTRISGQPIVELNWQQNPETDILGYTVYRATALTPSLTALDPIACSTNDLKKVACFDPNPPLPLLPNTPLTANYYVVAFDKPWTTQGNPSVYPSCPVWGTVNVTLASFPSGTRPGCPSALISVDITNGLKDTRPSFPSSVISKSTTNGLPTLSWSPATDTGSNGDTIAFYRIYRDPSSTPPPYSARTDTAPASPNPSYTDPTPPGSGSHTYYITAVDTHYQESDPISVVWP